MYRLLLFFFLIIATNLYAQTNSTIPSGQLYTTAPEWAKSMYGTNPSVNQVDVLYKRYYKDNLFVKSYHTQYYKRWRKAINNFVNDDGFYDHNKKTELKTLLDKRLLQTASKNRGFTGNWSMLGPFQNFRAGGTIESGAQANVYSVGQCAAATSILYCGTENGEVYKTLDGGDNWFNVSLSLITALAPQAVIANAGISALAVHPTNPEIVYIGSGSEVFKTIDSGINWTAVFDSNITLGGYIENPAEIFINPVNPQIVLVAGKAGMHRTADGGATWTQTLNFECFDVKANTNDPNILYTVRRNNATNTHQFLTSTNGGVNWTPQTTGWYNSTDDNRTVVGARIAVSNADPDRIYAFLIGDSKSGDSGFIGIYRSNDGGTSWANTMGFDGAPYDGTTHPNLISSNPDGSGFNQGFYNCAVMASNTNANEILVGGIGMWRSTDGGQTFTCIYNYGCGNYNPMHVDMQDFRAFGNEYWASTDGGVYKSNDLFATQPEFKMNGVNSVDFWGFDSGWNNDLLVGGTFHNGVDVYYEGFPSGAFLDLGGGEPASGYVNPSNTLRVYSSVIGSKIIPQTITGSVLNAAIAMLPNESPWFAESSEMEFHPSCHNILYLGKDNQLYKSLDGGTSFTSVYTAAANTEVLDIEISRANTETMYIVVRPNSGNASIIKTTDDWQNTSTITLPSTGGNRSLISLDPENDQVLWLAYARGNNGNKVFKTTSGGTSWTNETSSALNAQNIQSIVTIGGTNGGVYVGTSASVYYKNNSMSSWTLDAINLPATVGTSALKPFYRDGKIRLATYGKGIWESPLYEATARPVAKIMVDKLTATCAGDVFYFDDYSMLNHSGATWAWTFENANTATSNIRNPEVVFTTLGSHLVTLTVTNAAGVASSDTLTVDVQALSATSLAEDFEVQFMPEGWTQEASSNFNWTYNNTVGGFGQSTSCMMVNNYIFSAVGAYCDIIAPLNMTATNASDAVLTFDVAYALYSGLYADGLEVLISSDCGTTYTSVYNKVGADLATAPNTTSEFVPTDTQWRTETIDLAAYIGSNNVYVKFRNVNAYGQTLFIDNINLGNNILSVDNFETNTFLVYPNPVSSNGIITIKSPEDNTIKFTLYSIQGKQIAQFKTASNTTIPIGHLQLSSGLYMYVLHSENRIQKGKLLVSDSVRK
ncbi:T9SS type A sorting domain-containing protein [Lacinutrix jangbogonensis]|uniref:T9SS type A sorting domain-containing protein n=1 Tax=Lacinutrix jangbogonensis TaxID=1469557 RepID=UPI00053EC5FC|nr:T9SS type A sorting domain-containing protein [Lacinutrix jangbogonensis]